MPHTSSAKKRLRQTEKRRLRNRAVKRTVKTHIKRVTASAEGTATVEQLREEYNLAAKKLDQAAAKKVIHRNLAARKKSQLAKLLRDKQAAAKA
jgi:small subunit ribosomal protein S20